MANDAVPGSVEKRSLEDQLRELVETYEIIGRDHVKMWSDFSKYVASLQLSPGFRAKITPFIEHGSLSKAKHDHLCCLEANSAFYATVAHYKFPPDSRDLLGINKYPDYASIQTMGVSFLLPALEKFLEQAGQLWRDYSSMPEVQTALESILEARNTGPKLFAVQILMQSVNTGMIKKRIEEIRKNYEATHWHSSGRFHDQVQKALAGNT